MSVRITNVTAEAIPLFQGRLLEMWHDESLGFPPEALEAYERRWTVGALLSQVEEGTLILHQAHTGTTLAGVVLGTSPEGGVATMVWLLVERAFQNQGMGTALFVRACNDYRAMGAHKLKLTVSRSEALAFYAKQGMVLEGTHPQHWWQMDFWSLGLTL